MTKRLPIWGIALALLVTLAAREGRPQSGTDSPAEGPATFPVLAAEAPAPFSLEQSITISQGPGHRAFPDVVRLGDGRLLLVYRQGADHADSTGRIVGQLGTPDGRTWSEPVVLWDTPEIDDRDPSLTTLENGEVFANFFQYRRLDVGERTLLLHQVFAARSTDSGATFSPFIQVSSGPMEVTRAEVEASGLWIDGEGKPIMVWASSSPAVEIEGEILIPGYGGCSLNLGNLERAPRSTLSLWTSRDGGLTFAEQPLKLRYPERVWFSEPALLRTSSGNLLLQVRTSATDNPGGPGRLAQVQSAAGTGVWSDWRLFDFFGHAPYLTQLDSGPILSAFREVDDEYTRERVSLMVSLDEGESWSRRVLVEDCGEFECGYPSLVELGEGGFFVVYYADGGAVIKGAIYRPDPTLE